MYTPQEYEEDRSHVRHFLASPGKMGSQEGDARVIYCPVSFLGVTCSGCLYGVACLFAFTGVLEKPGINLTMVRKEIPRRPRENGSRGMPRLRKKKVPEVGEIPGLTFSAVGRAAISLDEWNRSN